jgi:hypothetical protein
MPADPVIENACDVRDATYIPVNSASDLHLSGVAVGHGTDLRELDIRGADACARRSCNSPSQNSAGEYRALKWGCCSTRSRNPSPYTSRQESASNEISLS